MRTSDEYKRLAAECIALAQQLADPADKARMLEMAEGWRRLAERAEGQKPDTSGDE